MTKHSKTIFLILGLTIIPFLIYGYLQLRSLNEDEQMAEAIYEKQMETVLFSLNQYADDLMGQWARKMGNTSTSVQENAADLVLRNESIQVLSIEGVDTAFDTLLYGDYIASDLAIHQAISYWKMSHDSTMNRLQEYFKAGFQKIQGVDQWRQLESIEGKQTPLTFMVYDTDSLMYNVFIVLEARYWVDQILGTKIQELAVDELNVAVLSNKLGEEAIFSSTNFNVEKPFISANLWILPELKLAIQTTGENYGELVKERSKNNFFFLLFTLLVLLIGVGIIIRNIQNALKVAQLKSDFVSNVSHEIRTPLSLIKMYAETLMLGRVTSENRKDEYYKVIYHESGRLTHLVNNILDFSRIEANKKTYDFQKVRLDHLVEKSYQNYAYTFKEQQVDCELLLNSTDVFIHADEQAIGEAISNLIENALKYSTQEKKKISISTETKGTQAYCHIQDNGIGIPKEELDRIFDRFYRIEGALTQQTKGTGMGLSLVKHIMEAHSGEVLVRSKINIGSTFSLVFPVNNN